MRRPARSAIFIVAAALFGAAAAARAQAGRTDWTLDPSLAVPEGGIKDAAKSSFGLELSGLYGFNDWLSGGLEAGYWWAAKFEGRLDGKLATDLDADGINDTNVTYTSDIDFKILQVTPCLKAGPWLKAGSWDWQPYALVGAGLYQTSNNSGTVTVNGTTSTGFTFHNATAPFGSTSNAWFGYNLGVGVTVKAGEHLRLGLDARYHQIMDGKPNAELFVPSLRLGWVF